MVAAARGQQDPHDAPVVTSPLSVRRKHRTRFPVSSRREVAAKALGSLHDVEMFERLIDLLSDKDRRVQDYALRSLRQMSGTPLSTNPDDWHQWWSNERAWLREEGYLVLKDDKRTGQIVGDDVDWSRTRAYGLGFNVGEEHGRPVDQPGDAPVAITLRS